MLASKLPLSAVIAAAALSSNALAQAPATPAPAGPWTLTANVGLFSQYIFRGLTQTDRQPAIQGGFDVAHQSGFYAGTWASNISWLHDLTFHNDAPVAPACAHGCSIEWDIYGGWKYAINDDWGVDVGLLYYKYPGHFYRDGTKPNTLEVYAAGSWKWASLKYSYSVDDTFGVPNNAWYLDLSANYPVNEMWTINAHVGRQEYSGSNTGTLDYTDWKLGFTVAVLGVNVGAFYSDTNAKDAGYTIANRNIGKATGTVFIQKTF